MKTSYFDTNNLNEIIKKHYDNYHKNDSSITL